MPYASLHVVVESEKIHLPRSNGDRDIEIDFQADWPESGPDIHPYLLYRVNLEGGEPAHLVIRINSREVVDQVVRDAMVQSFHKVFGGTVLSPGGNTLMIRIPDDEPGSLIISDLVVVYVRDIDTTPTPPEDHWT